MLVRIDELHAQLDEWSLAILPPPLLLFFHDSVNGNTKKKKKPILEEATSFAVKRPRGIEMDRTPPSKDRSSTSTLGLLPTELLPVRAATLAD